MVDHSSRVQNTIQNTIVGILGQIVTYIITFAYRTVFIMILSKQYLGLQGLFANVLSILSLAELGIGSAITFSLYKPLAEKNQEVIKSYMKFYAAAYRIIALVVAVAGLAMIPFLGIIVGDNAGIPHITVIFLLYLADTVSSYFFSYKRSIIIADQKAYINTFNINLFTSIRTIIQAVFLILFKNFIIVVAIQIVFTFLSNLVISQKAGTLYPYIKEKGSKALDPLLKSDLVKKIRAMLYHQVGSVVVLGTNNILISSFIGIDWVGIYSNYLLILGVINVIIQQFTQSVVASIGNMVSTESVEKTKSTFNILFFLNHWIYSFCTVCLLTLFNPFISIWIGSDYLFEFPIVLVIVINFYITGMRQNVLGFRNALGLFWYDRFKPIFEAAINLGAAILLLQKFGILGVFLGTMISSLTTSFWVEPFVLFKHYFKKGLLQYFWKYGLLTIVTAGSAIIMQIFASKIFHETFISFIILAGTCILVPNIIYVLLFFKTQEFKELFSLVKRLLKRKKA